MKFLNVSVSVEARKGVPCRIRWGRRTYTVRRLLDFWILQSRWWASEEKRVYFRLETDRGVVEVFRSDELDRAKREGRAAREERIQPAEPAGRAAPVSSSPGSPPPFVEGDTHTRELRQTESPYRPDAAALAGRRLQETAVPAEVGALDSRVTGDRRQGTDSPSGHRSASGSAEARSIGGADRGRTASVGGSAGARTGGSAASPDPFREPAFQWVLSKVID